MHKKGNLFYLIKSLSQTEKRYFRIFCTAQQANSNHLRLFDALDKQTVFDEDQIKKKFEGEKFIQQLHVTKNHLRKLILKSLRNYHTGISKETEVRNLITDAEILHSKELFDQCYYVLEKAEKIARRFESFPALIDVYEGQRKLYVSKYGPNSPMFKEVVKKQASAIKKLENLNRYWELVADVSDFRSGPSVEEKLAAKDLIQNPGLAASLRARILYHHTLFSAGLLQNQIPQAEKHIDAIIELLEAHPEKIKNEPGLYTSTLGNKITVLLYEKRWDEAFPVLELIRELPAKYGISKDSKFSVRARCRSYNLELEIYRDKKDLENGIRLCREVDQFIQSFEKAIPEDYFMLFWNQFAQFYFLHGNYTEALSWINKIIDSKIEVWTHLAFYARLLHLMIHFDLGNVIFIKYAVESHRRYFKKMKRLKPFERSYLAFFSKITNISKSDYPVAFKNFYTTLFEGDTPLANADMLDYVDIKSWLEEKMKR
ncbi:hypothetical protein QQ020_21505 [Fulvivirgaceae bacterium BMA12]|uniref:Tetratricopeptide repeat protein n=1 Tax=Agaribacillus aureus TaxID=3051825 RepID=A0ABT8LEB3_9BACT|nr:hypothetical protein [Fulvivirgaceae bacterium BMA12]